jgi:hypothetical protein
MFYTNTRSPVKQSSPEHLRARGLLNGRNLGSRLDDETAQVIAQHSMVGIGRIDDQEQPVTASTHAKRTRASSADRR